MQERHKNRRRYFDEQAKTTEKYVMPYLEQVLDITPETKVCEVGCGEGGNLLPFLNRGCSIVGIDLASNKIKNALHFFRSHPNARNAKFIADDIYKVEPNKLPEFDIVLMKDTIEHIPDQQRFLKQLKNHLTPGARIFFSFPPWKMPFGGHQQICRNNVLSKLPYIHLLPRPVYSWVLSAAGERPGTIEGLMDIRDTRLSINHFEDILNDCGYRIEQKTYFMVNPNYKIKFNLKPRKLPGFLQFKSIKDYFTTAVYCVALFEGS